MLNFDRFACTCNSWVWMYMTPVSGSLKVIPRVESESVGGLKVTLSEEALKEPPSELMNTEEAWVSKLSSEFSTRKKLCTWLSYQSGLQSQDTRKYSLSMESEPTLFCDFLTFGYRGGFLFQMLAPLSGSITQVMITQVICASWSTVVLQYHWTFHACCINNKKCFRNTE